MAHGLLFRLHRPAGVFMSLSCTRRALVLAVSCVPALGAQAQESFTFLTSWYAHAEPGGSYKARATGR